LYLRASGVVEKRINGAFGTGAGVVATFLIASIRLDFGMKESSGLSTRVIRKDVKDKGKYLLMVLWSPSLATHSLALFLSVGIQALAGDFVSSFCEGGSLFLRKLAS
jgi:hypothetical protein